MKHNLKIALELIQLLIGIKAIHQNSGKRNRVVQASISSSSIVEISVLKHSLDTEMSLEVIGSKRLKRFGV